MQLLLINARIIKGAVVKSKTVHHNVKDTNSKIRNTMMIESLIGSKPGSSSTNTGEMMLEKQKRRCSYLSISIFT